MTCLWPALVFVLAMVGGPQRSPLRVDEMHHEYIGLPVCALGTVTHNHLILTVGEVIAWDDATQHVYQRVNANLAIRSPLNIGYRFTLGRLPLFDRLNRVLDALLR